MIRTVAFVCMALPGIIAGMGIMLGWILKLLRLSKTRPFAGVRDR